MTPADLTARILKAARTGLYGPSGRTGRYRDAYIRAAREALICAKEKAAKYYAEKREAYSLAWRLAEDKNDTDYEEGQMDAAGAALVRVTELLTALQGGDDGTEGTFNP